MSSRTALGSGMPDHCGHIGYASAAVLLMYIGKLVLTYLQGRG